MTTRKHFEKAAETIRLIKNKGHRTLAASLWIETFSKENPRFDKDRFLKACDL